MVEDEVQPVEAVGRTLSNGAKLLVKSFPRAIHNRLMRTIGFRHDDIYTVIELAAYSWPDDYKNPDLVRDITDLEEVLEGPAYWDQLRRELQIVLVALGASPTDDVEPILEAVQRTRAALYKPKTRGAAV
jgi:hypothetical protein